MEKIIDEKTMGKGHKKYFLIKWKGYSASDNSWELAADVHAPKLIAEFRKRSKRTNNNKA